MFKQKIKAILRKLPKIVAVLLSIALVIYLGFNLFISIYFKPHDVRLTNVTDTSFTLSWITNYPMKGIVYYKDKDSILPGFLSWIGTKKAYDDRDIASAEKECVEKFNKEAKVSVDFVVDTSKYGCNEVKVKKVGEYFVHHVTLTDLEPNKEYHFRIGDGIFSRKMDMNKSATFLPLSGEVKAPAPIFGKIVNDKVEYVNDSVVYIKFINGYLQKESMYYSSVTSRDGSWYLDGNNIRTIEGEPILVEDKQDMIKVYAQYQNYMLSDANDWVYGNGDFAYPDIVVSDSWQKDLSMSPTVDNDHYMGWVKKVEAAGKKLTRSENASAGRYAAAAIAYLKKETIKGKVADVAKKSTNLSKMQETLDKVKGRAKEIKAEKEMVNNASTVGYGNVNDKLLSSGSVEDSIQALMKMGLAGGWDGKSPLTQQQAIIIAGNLSAMAGKNNGITADQLLKNDPRLHTYTTRTGTPITSELKTGSISNIEAKTCIGNGCHTLDNNVCSCDKLKTTCSDGETLWNGKCTENKNIPEYKLACARAGGKMNGNTCDKKVVISSPKCSDGETYWNNKCTANKDIGEYKLACARAGGKMNGNICSPNTKASATIKISEEGKYYIDKLWIGNTYIGATIPIPYTGNIEPQCKQNLANNVENSCIKEIDISELGAYVPTLLTKHIQDLNVNVRNRILDSVKAHLTTMINEQNNKLLPLDASGNYFVNSAFAIVDANNNPVNWSQLQASKIYLEDLVADALFLERTDNNLYNKSDINVDFLNLLANDDRSRSHIISPQRNISDPSTQTEYATMSCYNIFGSYQDCNSSEGKRSVLDVNESSIPSFYSRYTVKYLLDSTGGIITDYTSFKNTITIPASIFSSQFGIGFPYYVKKDDNDNVTIPVFLLEKKDVNSMLAEMERQNISLDDASKETLEQYNATNKDTTPDAKGVTDSVLGTTDNTSNNGNSNNSNNSSNTNTTNTIGSGYITYLPEYGFFDMEIEGLKETDKVEGNTLRIFYVETNGIEGFQMPADPDNPKETEDIMLQSSSLNISYKKSAEVMTLNLKRGINLVSFNYIPKIENNEYSKASSMLKWLVSKGAKVEHISYFSGGRWKGIGYVGGQTTGDDFNITPGKGYLIYTEADATVSIPGYRITSSVPVPLSAGWNLVGIHGYSQMYTARSFIDSINSVEGLTANNVSWWPTSKGKYEGLQVVDGKQYGFDFSLSSSNGYFVRISKFSPKDSKCKSLLWHAGGSHSGACGGSK